MNAELLHGHRPPAARHRGRDRVPAGDRARRARDADSPERRRARPRGMRRLRGHRRPPGRNAVRGRCSPSRTPRSSPATSSSPTASPEAPASRASTAWRARCSRRPSRSRRRRPRPPTPSPTLCSWWRGSVSASRRRSSPTSATSSRWRAFPRATYALLVSLLPATATAIGDRRARSDPHGGRGRRRGPRDRRSGAPPRALNGPCGATITRDDARQEDLARRGPDAGDRRRRRDPAPPGRRDGEHEGAAHPGRGQGRAERAPVHALSRQREERRFAGACTPARWTPRWTRSAASSRRCRPNRRRRR